MIRIVQSDRDRCITQRLAVLCTGKDHILHAPAAQLFHPLFAQNPAHGVRHITLPASIGTYDASDPVMEIEFYFICKGFKSLYFYVF